jgi:hypothetical protein
MKQRWRRILLTLGIVAVVCALYAWFFGFQTTTILETWWIGRKSPIVKETPRALGDLSISPAPGMKLSYLGYDFVVPWDDLDPSKTRYYPRRVMLAFRSGKVILFSRGQPREFVNTVLQNTDPDSFRYLYGEAPLQSDYAMHRLILEATPEKIKLLTPQKETVGVSMLLVIKAITVPEKSGIYAVQTEDFRGFQYGDPRRQPRHVVADLFADDGGVEFIFAGQGKGHPFGISQPEINRVLQTVHKSDKAFAQMDLEVAKMAAK